MTLTAAVTANSAPLTTGLVNFCDATAATCLDAHRLGSAQLTSAGVATIKFRPGIGMHHYKAVFVGTNSALTSASPASALTVTGSNSTTSLAVVGSPGSYQLTATVTGLSAPTNPTGSVAFNDTTNGNATLSSPSLTAGTVNFGFTNIQVNQCCASLIAVGDFNLDGIPDFVYTNSGGEYLALGIGDGTFQTALNLSSFQSQGVVVADFNEDGIPDVAIATLSNGLIILLGHGDGTFTAPSVTRTASGDQLYAGDFNGDGHMDLAQENSDGNSITILMGEGDGTFTASTISASGLSLASVGDFNGDGLTDLVLTSTNTTGAVIYLSNGDATFRAAAMANVPALRFVVVGDLNGDGKLDIVATSVFGTNTAYVLLGGGDGTLTLASSSPTGSDPIYAAIGDFNGDGMADVAITNYSSSNITVLIGSGDGMFASAMNVPADSFSMGLAAADFNGDGLPDLIIGDGGFSTPPDNLMTELLSHETATATATSSEIAVPGSGMHQLVAVYSGNSTYSQSTSSPASVTAGANLTRLNLVVSPSSGSTPGQQVVLNAILTPSSSPSQSTNGETVTFYSGSTNLGTGTLANGYTSLNLNNLPLGLDVLTAKYAGDPNFASSTSPTVSYDVAYSTTLTTAVSPATGNVYGQQVTLTATLSPASGQGKVTDGEVVSFASGGKLLGTATLAGGVATLKTTALTVGTAGITASYLGDDNFSASNSTAFSYTTAQLVPTITWSQPAASIYTGAAVGSRLFTATSATPGQLSYTASLNGATPITINPSSIFAAGFYTLTATLTPTDGTDYAAATASVSYTVTPAPLTLIAANYTRLYAVANPTFSAQVSGALNNDSFTASGTTTATTSSPVGSYPITYAVTGANLANYTVATSPGTLTITPATPKLTWSTPSAITYGTALSATQLSAASSVPGTFTYFPALGTVLFAGSSSLTATFTPTDATNYSPQTATVPLTINKAPLTLAANSQARVYGAANPTFTGTITGAVNNDAFVETYSTTAALTSIVGSYPIVPAATGVNLANYAVTGTNGSLTVSQAGTSITFAMSNQNTTFTATVMSLTSGSPTGTVAFYEGQSIVGSGTVTNGVATYTAGPLPAGDFVLSAEYSGDADFTQSASPPTLNLALTPSATSLTVTPGSSATDVISLVTPAGYTGPVQLSCTGLPAAATCTFSPASISFTGSNTGTASTLTITTNTSAGLATPMLGQKAVGLTALAIMLWLPGALLASKGRRRRASLTSLLSLLLLLGVGLTVSGCGGGTTPSTTTGTTQLTPPGSSIVQVTATGTAGLTTTSSVSLTVQ